MRKRSLLALLAAIFIDGSSVVSSQAEIVRIEVANAEREVAEKVIQSDEFWGAKDREEATRIYFQEMARYAEEAGYRHASWMPGKLRDLQERLIYKLYNSEGTPRLFLESDSVRRREIYDLIVQQGY